MNTLKEIARCKACQMELLPFLDVNDHVVQPVEYCDDVCRSVYSRYQGWFDAGRENYFSPGRSRPTIDMRI